MTIERASIETGRREPNRSPSVWTVVVHYGDPAVTDRVLERLAHSTAPMAIVVVDNAGTFKAPAGVRYIRLATNLGFAGGANAGARLALSEGAAHVWFLNNDAEPEPDALEKLLETVRSCRAACIVGSLEVDPRDPEPGNLEAYLLPGLPATLRATVRVAHGSRASVDFLSGFSMLVSRSAFEALGFFDETYFHYCEDVDLCLRARQRGVDVVLDATAPLRHTRSLALGSRSRTVSYYYFRNRLLLLSRYRRMHPLLTLLLAAPRRGLWPLIAPRSLAPRDRAWLRGAWQGTLDAIRGRRGQVSLPGSPGAGPGTRRKEP
jgi:GT2 family glycosyltransferase